MCLVFMQLWTSLEKKNRASSQNVYATVDKIKSEAKKVSDGDDDDYADIEVFTTNNSSNPNIQVANSDPIYRDSFGFVTKFKLSNYKSNSPLWVFYGLLALLMLIVAAIVALAVTFTLIARIQSDITSIKGSLNFRCQRLYMLNKVSLNNFELQIKEVSANTSSKLEWLDVDRKVLLSLAYNLSYLLSTTSFSNEILSLKEKLNEVITNRFLNLSLAHISLKHELNDATVTFKKDFQQILNTSATDLANAIKALHVFDSCENVTNLKFPFFGPGLYKIMLPNGTISNLNCFHTDSSICDGMSGQWRRVAYLNTSETNEQCPRTLMPQEDHSGCQVCGNGPKCSSVIYPTGGLYYSRVCGRVHAQYFGSPDGFHGGTFTADDNYVDGVSVTYGMCPKNHIWTFVATITSMCSNHDPGFVNSHYFCENVVDCRHEKNINCTVTQLWNGTGNGGAGYFHRNLTESTSENIEIRVCRDQVPEDEDIFLTFVEIYVSP